ncbi:MAG: 50S ribosomal protein L25 [Chloroflexi bacterium]|nr:50S ribosomal protein L25 [Chloroflexota bacterium]
MDQITVEAQSRTALGKKNGALRRTGITPIHVYGPETPSESLQADTKALIVALNEAGYTTPITLAVGSGEHFAMVQHVHRHPVTERLLHVDLMTISRTQRMRAAVPLHFEGEALAAREEGVEIFEDLHQLEVEALPLEMPHALVVDLTLLDTGDKVIHAADIQLPPNVTLVTDPTAAIARTVVRRPMEEGEGEGAPARTEVPASAQPASEQGGDSA